MITADVAVIGAGPIGAAIAWRCAQRGQSVVLCDPDPARGAWYAAAGMLAPVSELSYTETALHRLGVASLARYPDFVAELEALTGHSCGLVASGTVSVAWDAADLHALRDLQHFGAGLGVASRLLTAGEMRALEPGLAAGLPGGRHVPGDHQIDPRRLHSALIAACRATRVRMIRSTVAFADEHRLRAGDAPIAAGTVVLAAGAWSGSVAGQHRRDAPPVRPVKGQTLRLRLRVPAPASPRPVVRADVKGAHVYIVFRTDGEVIVGASTEEAGFDTSPRAGAVYELLRDAQSVLPELSEAVLDEVSTALRPGSPDNAPLLGWGAEAGLIIATGHYRNGILLTPVTADAIAELIETNVVPDAIRPFTPERFLAVAR